MRNFAFITASLLIFCAAQSASAFDLTTISHEAPLIKEGESGSQKITLSLSAKGVIEARVLIPTDDGVKAVMLSKAGDTLSASFQLKDFPRYRYQFQIRAADGEVAETSYFAFRSKGTAEAEKTAAGLREEALNLEAKASQLEQTLSNVKNADPKTLGKTRNQELAKALVLLGQRERELKELEKGETK